jgi:hypothetical protein
MTHMPMEPEAFAEQVAGLLRRLQPEYAIAMVTPRELLVNGRRLDLDNLYRMVTNEPGRGQEIVEHFLDQLFTGDGLEVGDMPFEFARARVMPRIQPESIFEHLSRDLVAHVPFVNNTVIVFVTDLPQMTVSITTEQMVRWGVNIDDLDEAARENLDGYAPELEFQVIESREGGKAVILAEQDGYDAARLLMGDLYKRLAPAPGGRLPGRDPRPRHVRRDEPGPRRLRRPPPGPRRGRLQPDALPDHPRPVLRHPRRRRGHDRQEPRGLIGDGPAARQSAHHTAAGPPGPAVLLRRSRPTPRPRSIPTYHRPVILLIDNYDSFTWNLVQRFGELDPTIELDRDLVVARNDRITPDEAAALDDGRGPSHVVISPGPCTPNEAGISAAIIERFAGASHPRCLSRPPMHGRHARPARRAPHRPHARQDQRRHPRRRGPVRRPA